MTLEEAKKKIKAQANAEWEEFKKTGSMLCQGFALGADDALETLDKVESSGNPEQLTLKELARELRKIFNFRWLTYDRRGDDWYVLNLWKSKPVYQFEMWYPKSDADWDCPQAIDRRSLRADIELDLSGYPNMPITNLPDYSKCIVEVSDGIG